MRHTLSILVENRPGELARIVNLFSARGFNIESLTVAETLDPNVSHISVVTVGDDKTIEQITKQVDKQVRVLQVRDVSSVKHIEREMAFINVAVEAGPARQEVLNLASVFGANLLEINDTGLILEVTGEWSKVWGLVQQLEPLGIREIVRSGVLAITCLSERAAESQSREVA